MLGVFSANAISAGVGALIGGRLCDLFDRKKIYQYDMLFYASGMLWLAFAVQPWMIVVGFVLAGANGFFFPYILRTVSSESQATSVAMQAMGFLIAMVSIGLVFMRFSDKVNLRLLFGFSVLTRIAGMAVVAIFPLTTPVTLAYLVLV